MVNSGEELGFNIRESLTSCGAASHTSNIDIEHLHEYGMLPA